MALLWSQWVWAESTLFSEAAPVIKWGAFLDTYYCYDFDRPPDFDRAYTTQPARSNEFNINLAYIEAKLEAKRVRGRFALQTGTSVLANYAGEPTNGTYSGPTLSRIIQEAFAGYQITKGLWIDAGIYFSHIGYESFISKNNWAYSRSLSADYSPYYQSGVKLSYEINSQLSAQLHLINGWQVISAPNQQKALGAQIAYKANQFWSVTYNNFIGNVDGSRFFNDLFFEFNISEKLALEAGFDIGFQNRNNQNHTWEVLTIQSRYHFTPEVAWTARVERFVDPSQVVAYTGTPDGFNVVGTSTNVDVELHPGLLWRSEVRKFWSANAIYPASSGKLPTDSYVVTSLSLSI